MEEETTHLEKKNDGKTGKLAHCISQEVGHLRMAFRCPEITVQLLVGPLAGPASTPMAGNRVDRGMGDDGAFGRLQYELRASQPVVDNCRRQRSHDQRFVGRQQLELQWIRQRGRIGRRLVGQQLDRRLIRRQQLDRRQLVGR